MLLAVLAGLAVPAQADAAFLLLGDSTSDAGRIDFWFIVSPGNDVDFYEVRDGRRELIGTAPDLSPDETRPFIRVFRDAARWRCDRRDRVFVAVAHSPYALTGEEQTSTIRTPSCRDRLRLDVPLHVRRGHPVRAVVRDALGIGGVRARLCLRARCRRVVVGRRRARVSFATGAAGRYAVRLRSRKQTIRRTVAVGVPPRAADRPALPEVLTTGDSMMQTLDTVLQDDLAGSALVDNDAYPGTGLTKTDLFGDATDEGPTGDWRRIPRRQVRRLRPDATVMFIGTNDAYAMNGVECCAAAWRREYARRVRRAMRTYQTVVWLTLPAVSDVRRRDNYAAINAAIRRAAADVPRARVVDAAALLTPGGVFADPVVSDGRPVDARQDDGVHLTVAGAEIVAPFVLQALTDLGVGSID
jgi:lysophospholipase L1-like esterase